MRIAILVLWRIIFNIICFALVLISRGRFSFGMVGDGGSGVFPAE